MGRQRPIWSERERPDLHLVDAQHPQLRYDYAALQDDEIHQRYADWINSYKVRLHNELMVAESINTYQLSRHYGIDLAFLSKVAAEVADRPQYPLHRVTLTNNARALPAYDRALRDKLITPELSSYNRSNVRGEFISPLHFVRLRNDYAASADRTSVISALAHGIGNAMLAPLTQVRVLQSAPPSPENSLWWYGYAWRYNGKCYGEVIQEAAAAKIAAETRHYMGARASGTSAYHPLLESYREREGVPPAAIGAIALDMIGDTIQARHLLHSTVRHIAVNGQEDERARAELSIMVCLATGGQLDLEDIEAMPSTNQGLGLGNLRRIEEVCGVDEVYRPSKYLLSR